MVTQNILLALLDLLSHSVIYKSGKMANICVQASSSSSAAAVDYVCLPACLPASLPACLSIAIAPVRPPAFLLCCLFLFFSLALYVTVLFEATRIQCNDDDDGNETTLSAACGGAAAWRSTPTPPRRSFSSSMRDESTRCS